MKAHKKQERKNKGMLDWLAKHGKDVSNIDIDTIAPTESISASSLEGEAALAYWEKGKDFKEKKCTHCGRTFATNYNSVGNCSDRCRIAELADIGITWSPSKTQHERWGRTPPLVVGQEALEVLKSARQAQESDTSDSLSTPQQETQLTDDSHTVPDFSLH